MNNKPAAQKAQHTGICTAGYSDIECRACEALLKKEKIYREMLRTNRICTTINRKARA